MSAWPQSIARVIRRSERPAAPRTSRAAVEAEPPPQDARRPAVEISPNDPIVAYFQSAPGAVDVDEPRARVARARGSCARRACARRAARQPGRAHRPAQPRAAALRPGLLDRRPQAARLARRAGGAGAPGRAARAPAGGRGALARADRAGAPGRDADPAELPAARAARPARLAGLRVLPAGARGRRRLLRLLRAAGRPDRRRDRRRHRQGRPGRDGDGRDAERAARLGSAGRLAGRGARARQRPHVPGHAGEDVRHLPVRRARPGAPAASASRTPATTCPYVRTADGTIELRATGMPLGLLPGHRSTRRREAMLEPGQTMLLHSDGVAEAHAARAEMFGFPRLLDVVGARSGRAR